MAKKERITLFHNPRCSKSRAALALLEGQGAELEIVEYLKTPPTAAELASVVKKLGLKPEALVRKGEEIYKSRYRDKTMGEAQWLEALARDPILIERPIAIKGERAVLGRPPERVLEIL